MDKKLTIYLAGPIGGCTDSECNDWRDLVIRRMGKAYNIRNPMDRDYRDHYLDVGMAPEIVDLDKRDINNSDVVIANITKHSTGTAMEILYAWEQHKIIVAVATPDVRLSPWHIRHATKIVYTLEEALDWIIDFVR